MTFSEPLMKSRYEIFLNGLREHMQKSKSIIAETIVLVAYYFVCSFFSESHLFAEPGSYMSMMNGVALQGFKASNFTHEMIKG